MKINHATKAKGAYPIVLVSYDIACPAYKDANTAKFVKSWLTYVTSDEGRRPPPPLPAPPRCRATSSRRSPSPSRPSRPSDQRELTRRMADAAEHLTQ